MASLVDDWDLVSATSGITQSSWDYASVDDARDVGRPEESEAGTVGNLDDLAVFDQVVVAPQEEASTGGASAAHPTVAETGGAAATDEASEAGHATVASHLSVPHCPLTLDVMRDPTRCLVDGRIYERSAIEQWVKANGNSPFTRQPVALWQLKPLNERDDDAVSVTTAAGWPRLNREAMLYRGLSSSPNGVAQGSSYLEALVAGGGGVDGPQAQRLTARERRFAPKRKAVQRRQAPRRAAAAPQQEEEDLTDFIDDEWSARKYSKGRLARWKGKLVVTRAAHGRFRSVSVPYPLPRPQLATVPETSFDEDEGTDNNGDYDDGGW